MKKALLAVGFGVQDPEARRESLDAVEEDLRSGFPQRDFYRAWVSPGAEGNAPDRDGEMVSNLQEALGHIRLSGVRDLLVQPLFMLRGAEYAKLRKTLEQSRDQFTFLRLGAPLLAEETDVSLLAIMLEGFYSGVGRDCLVAFMGRGSPLAAYQPYILLDRCFVRDGYTHFCVGTWTHAPGFIPVMERARLRRPKEMTLAPLTVSPGKRTLEAMSGPDPESWTSRLEKAGFSVRCEYSGLGVYAPVRALFVAHARKAVFL